VTRFRLSRIFWIGAAAILIAAALVALTAVLRGDFSDTDGRILGTLAAALLAGSTAVAGLALVERGGRILGWTAVALSPVGFALLTYAIWDFVFDSGGEDAWRWGWTGAVALVAALIAVTARLLARAPRVVRLAFVTGALAALAVAMTIYAIWQEDPGDTIGRTIAVLWILTGLGFLLVPVLQRFTTAGEAAREPRVLATLDDVELVATHSREGTIDVTLEPGERLLLRKRA
jgi:MFS family permease